ncbi:MAG: hypothetical protein AAGI44_03035 [Pseudomonadota bacterium]
MNEKTALLGHAVKCSPTGDGRLQLLITVDPAYHDIAHDLVISRDQVAVAAVKNPEPYQLAARVLWESAFFSQHAVHCAVGSDAEYLLWLREQGCAAFRSPISCGHCAGDVVPAHVRRVSRGAGTGYKPPYSAIPLCDRHHSLQHQKGESVIGPPDWWESQADHYVKTWAWLGLRCSLGYEKWAYVPPTMVIQWAREHDVEQLLPEQYRRMAWPSDQ